MLLDRFLKCQCGFRLFTSSFLDARCSILTPPGITLQGARLTCSQYAGDLTVFLLDEAALPAFLQAMQVFGDASSQRLNPAKSQAMLLEARMLPPVPPPGGGAASVLCGNVGHDFP